MEKASEREKCFVIMPISDQGNYPKGHFTHVYEQIFKPAIEAAGYEPYRVDEDKISTPIINKIFEAIQDCPMAICDLSNRNPNVLYELGLRQAYDKPVVLIQDEKTEKIFDIAGINTVQYNSNRLYENVMEARKNIKEAICSMKEGKENTIVKIVKAGSAHISKESLSKADRTEIMLNSIMSELKYMKHEMKKREQIEELNYNRKIIPNISGFVEFRVALNSNVKNKEIDQALREIMSYGMEVSWNRSENELIVTIYDIRDSILDESDVINTLSILGNVKVISMT